MGKNNIEKNQNPEKKGYVFDYNHHLKAMELNIYDTEGMTPFYVRFPKAGLYKIIRTNTGKLQMIK